VQPFDEAEFPHLPEDLRRLSFRRFADVYVRAFAARAVASRLILDTTESPGREALYQAVWQAFARPPHDAGFFGRSSADEVITRLTEWGAPLLGDAYRELTRKSLTLCLARVELEAGSPRRLYPFSRDPAESSPRVVVMDPKVRFGRPTVSGHGTPTDVLFERHQAGDSIADLAEDYGLTAEEVEEAIRYEAAPVAAVQ
jgi:uncharacterized protein (DUF433 family)